jgi:membrane protease YdiL (CAAX protease family)
MRTVGLFVGGLGLLSVFVGLIGYVVVPALRGTAAAADRGAHRMILATTLLAVLAANVLPLLLLRGRPEFGLRTTDGFLIAAVSTEAALLLLAWVRAAQPGVLSLRALGAPRGVPRVLGWGLLGGVLLFGLSAVVQVVLQRFGVVQTQMEGYAWMRALAPHQFLLIVLAGAVLAPIAEETFFRGYVFASYRVRYGPLVAAVLSALLFGALHLNVQAFVPIFCMGLLLAWLYQRTESLLPGIIAHGLNNALAFAALYYFGMQ